MKKYIVFLAVAVLIITGMLARASGQGSQFSITSTQSPIKNNPDGTYYPGDRFQVTVYPHVLLSGSDSLVGISYSWYYDSSMLVATGTDTSKVFAISPVAPPATYTITITATATFVYYVNGTAYYYSLTSSTSQSVTVIKFVLNLSTHIVNATDSNGCVARNPDGTFYRGDTFGIFYNATFKWQKQRPDIGTNVTIQYNKTAFYEYKHNATEFLFNVTKIASPEIYSFVLNATATNSYGEKIGTNTSTIYVALVAYRPMFTYFTYMDYNNLNSSAYRRPFVTLVRYGGNRPNYTSSGGQTWAAFNSKNSTGERARIDNFTFSTAGWRVHATFVGSNVTRDVQYVPIAKLYLQTTLLNKTLSSCRQLYAWSNRVQKYYFMADWTRILNYTAKGITYFNTTITAWSRNFSYLGNDLQLFNTTYLHEPTYYNGLLIFRTYDGLGKPDPSVSNVTIRVFNPSPLNPFLLSQLKARFGSDASVQRAFERDLYAANSSMTLRPFQVKGGHWYFLINQTNIAAISNASQPVYTISVIGNTSKDAAYAYTTIFPFVKFSGELGQASPYNFTYRAIGSYSTIMVSNKSFTSSPFRNFTAYDLEPRGSLIMLPLNFTYPANFNYGGVMSYLLWSYNQSTPFYTLTTAPGQMGRAYMLLWGQNVTIPVCVGGCLFGFTAPPQELGAGSLAMTPILGQMTAGATQVWVKSSLGTLLANESLPDTYPSVASFAPPGFIGLHTLRFYVPSGTSSISFLVKNSWGAVAEVDNIPVNPVTSSGLSGDTLLIILTIIFLLALGFYFLGELNKRL